MTQQILDSIVNGNPNITVNINCADLRSVILEIVNSERMRIDEAEKKSREMFMVTQSEAQKLLGGISLVTLLKIRKKGELIPTTIGRKILYRRSDIDAYIEKHQEIQRKIVESQKHN